MKKLLILFVFVATTVSATPLEYPTLFLLQWTYNCSQNLKPSYEVRGFDAETSLQLSIHDCSCVIDEFRKHHYYQSILVMNVEQRKKFGEEYAKICKGVIKES